MVHILKHSITKKLCSFSLAAVMVVCAGFSGYTADDPQQQGEPPHQLSIRAVEVLETIARGALSEEETVLYTVDIPRVTAPEEREKTQPEDTSSQTTQQPAPEVYEDTSAQPTQDTSSQHSGGQDASLREESGTQVSIDEQPADSSEHTSSETSKQEDTAYTARSYKLDRALAEVLESVNLPFNSKLMKAQLAQSLTDKRLVRFYAASDTGCEHCQVIVTVNPATSEVSIFAVNSDESKRHTFTLSIIDEAGMPMSVDGAEQKGMTADKRVLDGTLADADLPDGALVEVLEISLTYKQDNSASSAASSQPQSSEPDSDTSSQQSEAPNEEPPAEEAATIAAGGEENQGRIAAFAQDEPASQQQTALPEEESSQGTSSEGASSREPASQEDENSSQPDDSSASEQPDNSQPSESAPSESQPSEQEPSDDTEHTEVQTTILLLTESSRTLALDAFAAVGLEVGAGFSAATAGVPTANGKITITKKIDANWAAHGDPIFVYTLEKKQGNQFREIASDYIRFTGGDTRQKSINFNGLAAGTYRITELDTLRYSSPKVTEVKNGKASGASVEFEVTKRSSTATVTYQSSKKNNDYFSHTDAAKNSFSAKKK